MNEFRLNPDTLQFGIVTPRPAECMACKTKGQLIESVPFKGEDIKVYEIKERVQPSKYELKGKDFKSSPAHGYEEILVDQSSHGDKFYSYSVEDISKLLLIIKNRKTALSKYDFGENFIATRYLQGHGYFDLMILPVPNNVYKKCIQCVNIENVDGREIRRTENFIEYVPFFPIKEIEIDISPIKHISFDVMDEVLAFDLAGMIANTLSKLKEKNMTLAILEDKNKHFSVKILPGELDAFSLLNIKELQVSPEAIAENLRKKIQV